VRGGAGEAFDGAAGDVEDGLSGCGVPFHRVQVGFRLSSKNFGLEFRSADGKVRRNPAAPMGRGEGPQSTR
jgi:hypothetical protein